MPVIFRSSVRGPHIGELAALTRVNYSATPLDVQPLSEQITPPATPGTGARPFRVEFPTGQVFMVNDYSPEGAYRQACALGKIVATAREAQISF